MLLAAHLNSFLVITSAKELAGLGQTAQVWHARAANGLEVSAERDFTWNTEQPDDSDQGAIKEGTNAKFSRKDAIESSFMRSLCNYVNPKRNVAQVRLPLARDHFNGPNVPVGRRHQVERAANHWNIGRQRVRRARGKHG